MVARQPESDGRRQRGRATLDHVRGQPGHGTRVDYADLPPAVRAWTEGVLGEPVATATTQPGGFSPGVAARLTGSRGRRLFVKAVDAAAFAATSQMHRREARVAAALPGHAPVPRLLSTYDDGRWVALAFADVDGRHPTLPWRREEMARVLATIDELHADLTPCPVPDVPAVGDGWRPEFTGWRDAAAAGPPAGLHPWCVRHLQRLADLESRWPQAAAGDSLLHLDLRADNLLLAPDRVWVLDWPWAARGAPVFDLVAFAPSVAMQGGPPPEDLLASSTGGQRADPDAVTTLVATVAGYFLTRALLPPPAGLPTVRGFQAAQGEVALRWLRQRTGWP